MTPYWLRPLLGIDILAQTFAKDGKPGVTLSSRIGTGVAHGKRWAIVAAWLLEENYPLRWIFGPGHCAGAVLHDYQRNQESTYELTDPTVVAWVRQELGADALGDYGTWRPRE